jgi:hypothetical protein
MHINLFMITEQTQSYLVEVTHKPTQEKTSGWIAGSSVTQEPRFLLLKDSLALSALQPQAKRYASYVKVYKKVARYSML